MSPKKRAQQASGPDPLPDAMDRLYGAPLDQFVALRRELAHGLREAGELPASRIVAMAAKPTRTAWALNQVARRQPERLRALFDARDAAAKAQTRGDGQEVQVTVRQYRDQLADVVRAARNVLAHVGVSLDATQARRIAESLQATSAADDEVRAKLMAGRLARDVEAEDTFAGFEMGPIRARERAARELAIEKGRQRVALLETKVREARADVTKADAASAHAQSVAERARRTLGEAERELEQARGQLQQSTR